MLRNKRNSILCALCPDKKCRSKLLFSYLSTMVECSQCGQCHNRSALQNIHEVPEERYFDSYNTMMNFSKLPKRGMETVKVMGLSNYHCKLLSSLLTKYGMDKQTQKATLLTEMNQGDIFDCGLFGDRAFLIDEEHINVPGFGRDVSGSSYYLSQTLDLIKSFNEGEERLLPIHADGDGHCLVHAVSRALVGRELFWHPLRCCLKKHLEDKIVTYKELLNDFIDQSEWKQIIAECDPDFIPPDNELLGLRNIHVFGLSNVLKRPIILLDSLECMKRTGDYAALFLPTLSEPDQCRGKDKQLNKPLCIAWSSPGHNHYIPLVGIKKRALPILPSTLLPKAWGVPQRCVTLYIDFDEHKNCTIGGDRNLGDPYIQRLVTSMEELYLQKYGVHPSLIADVRHYIFRNTGDVGADWQVAKTKLAIEQGRLYKCLDCGFIEELRIQQEWFVAGGVLFNHALHTYGRFVANTLYQLPLHGIVCRYDKDKNELQPVLNMCIYEKCHSCKGKFRKMRADGTVIYKNEDKTKTPSKASTCGCGYKHFWDGKEYDNPPQKLNVLLDWNNKHVRDTVVWFENESNPDLNSNAYKLASEVVQKHFPGEFGSEVLVQRVVEQLLNQTKIPELWKPAREEKEEEMEWNSLASNKHIIPGSGILHKEELGVSVVERQILQRVTDQAVQQQQKTQTAEKSATQSKPIAQVLPKRSFSPETTETPIEAPSCSASVKADLLTEKFVRVVTSDGRQSKLHWNETGISYTELQAWITEKFQIPQDLQKVKYGFPPEELKQSDLDTLCHGDRITVEVIPKVEESSDPDDNISDPDDVLQLGADDSAQDNLRAFLEVGNFLTSYLTSWEFAKKVPGNFKRNGHYYIEFAKEVGLFPNVSHTFQNWPNKVFRYNVQKDSIELYVPPHGSFPVYEFVDQEVEEATSTKLRDSTSNNTIRTAELTRQQSFFQGVKRNLPSTEFPQRNRSIFGPGVTTTRVRKGPGYSVLCPVEIKHEPESETAKAFDRFQALSAEILGNCKSLVTKEEHELLGTQSEKLGEKIPTRDNDRGDHSDNL